MDKKYIIPLMFTMYMNASVREIQEKTGSVQCVCDFSERHYKELYVKLLQLAEGMENGNICFYYICKSCEGKKRLIGVPKISGNYAEEDVIVAAYLKDIALFSLAAVKEVICVWAYGGRGKRIYPSGDVLYTELPVPDHGPFYP